jgi:CDP-diacylglycerol--serine O-phosphatidyltransferase
MLPNALTLCAILCGLTSIRLSGEGRFALAAVAIFAAVALDTADGLAARLLSAASAIGAELDSLADFVNFGVAPALLLYWSDLIRLGVAGWLAAAAYVLAAGWRLARFNVHSKTSRGDAPNWFSGLPTTAAAAAVSLPPAASIVMTAIVIAAGALMLSTLRVPAPFKRYGSGSRQSG